MESVNEFDILLSAYQPKTIENESSGGVAGFRVQANREANPPPALIKSLKTHLGVQISFVSQEQGRFIVNVRD